MLDKLKQDKTIETQKERLIKSVSKLRDVHNIGRVAFLVLVLLVTWSGIKAIQTNYNLQKDMYELEKSNDIKRLENANIVLKNEYYKTSQYREITARQNLGLGAPGETVLIVPDEAALAHVKPLGSNAGLSTESEQKKLPFWQQNFRDWMNFFLGRRGTSS